MNDSSIKSGTIMGTIFALLGIVSWVEIGKTVVLGSIGVAVSFLVSLALKKITGAVERFIGSTDNRKNDTE